MKKLILALTILISQAGFANYLDALLARLNTTYQDTPQAFAGAKVGVENGITNCSLSQENMVAELERTLKEDSGFCEYKTEIGFNQNISNIEDILAVEVVDIVKELTENNYISHISSRQLLFQHVDETCDKKQVRIVLTDGSLIWLDF